MSGLVLLLALVQGAADFNQRGMEREKNGDLEGSLADTTKAIELHPKEGAYYSNRGNVLRALRRTHDALKEFDEAMRRSAPVPRRLGSLFP